MHLARRLTSRSLEEIGGYFGGRDHTTVMYADDKITKTIQKDEELRLLLDNIVAELRRKK
jgi:chromosomal replication initiator protein